MILIVHGGAGNKRPTKKTLKKLSACLDAGYAILKDGGSALDAVVAAITVMEDSGLFNAGAGSMPQLDGVRRLDASLMDGKGLQAGAVVGLEGIRNPIRAAQRVMDTPHVMLTGLGARRVAQGLPPLPRPDARVLRRLREAKKKQKKTAALYEKLFSTVGAAAQDRYGNLAAGTSTGGIAAMLPGRVGDSPVIGAGTYADNASAAVSCTGTGEAILRRSLAKEICMNLQRLSPARAARTPLRRIQDIGGEAGVIVLTAGGRFALMHTTAYMAAGYITAKGRIVREKGRHAGITRTSRIADCA